MKISVISDFDECVEFGTPMLAEILYTYNDIEIKVPFDLSDKIPIINDAFKNSEDIRYILKITENELSKASLKYNYSLDGKSHRLRFVCSKQTVINLKCISALSIDISEKFAELNINRQMYPGDSYDYKGTGILVNNNLVSWCIENSHYLPAGETEIGVGTIENCRKMGYAASNTALLCDLLIKREIQKIYYECDILNIASKKVAEKVNLDLDGEVFYFSFKKNK